MFKSNYLELEEIPPPLPKTFNIEIIREDNTRPIKQLLSQVSLNSIIDEKGRIPFNKLLSKLLNEYNIPIDNQQIFYYYPAGDIYINCGTQPIGQEVKILVNELESGQLTIKIRQIGLLKVERLMFSHIPNNKINNKSDDESESAEITTKKKQCRRTKQRRIGHIISKVIQWRKYYSGTMDEDLQHEKYSLQEAANQVGISKKSLDDYLFQIRYGYRFGFNFNEHYNEKVGILRDFVRQKKKLTSKKEVSRKRKNRKEDE